jgi:hypothetical protein
MAKSAKSQVGEEIRSATNLSRAPRQVPLLFNEFDVFGVTKNLQKQSAPPSSQMLGESLID